MNIQLVIVTYYPDLSLLTQLISSLYSDVNKIHIIDNSESEQNLSNFFSDSKIIITSLKSNKGIAFAQNVGIMASILNGANFIILSDQDSIYPENYFARMISPIADFNKVAAIAPMVKEVHQNSCQGFSVKKSYGYKMIYPLTGNFILFQAIASGLIINVNSLKTVGLMAENLFIDWVDYEWCWRASKAGYDVIGNADVAILHRPGNSIFNFLNFKKISCKNSLRYYYITRNAFYLSLYSKNLSIIQKIYLFTRSFRYIFLYPFLSKNIFFGAKYVFLGFFHGLFRKLGKYN
jgi:rhamnosyltransferase